MTIHRLDEHLARPMVREQLRQPAASPLLVFLRGGLQALVLAGADGRFPLPVKRGMIQLLDAVEDVLAVERTLPSRAERRARWHEEGE